MGDNASFGLVAQASDVRRLRYADLLLAKEQAGNPVQLMNLLSLLPTGIDIFVVGENRSGVRSAEQMLADYAPLNKVDSARRCGAYHGHIWKTANLRSRAVLGRISAGKSDD